MQKLYADSILIGSQWQKDKTISINSKGIIESISPGRIDGAESVKGAIIPGMVNCHSHAFQRAFAGLSEYRANQSDSFWSWRDIMYQFVARLAPDDVFYIARYLYLEMLKAGYTCVAEFHYLHHQPGGEQYDNPAEMSFQVINAAGQTGIAMTHLPVLYSYAGFGQQQPSVLQRRFVHQTEDYCWLLEQLDAHIAREDTLALGIAPHSLRAVSAEQLKTVLPVIKRFNVDSPVHIHIAEQIQEVTECEEYYHKRPVEWLLENFELDERWCLIHATHLTTTETHKLAKSGAVAGLCATTEANLGDGIFPTANFLDSGGRFAIGSDSHIAVNVADELKTLEYCQRLNKHQRAVLTSKSCRSVGQNLYLQAARNGALSVNQNVGELNVGKRADLVVLDTNHPTLYAREGSFILDSAIFGCSAMPVKDVMVAGQWQIKDREHPQQQVIENDYLKVLKKLAV